MKKEITLDISCRYALARPFVDETRSVATRREVDDGGRFF